MDEPPPPTRPSQDTFTFPPHSTRTRNATGHYGEGGALHIPFYSNGRLSLASGCRRFERQKMGP